MDKMIVGKIVKIHGIKGAVKVIPIIDEEVNFADLKGVFIGNSEVFHEFQEVFAVSGAVGVLFKDIKSVDDARKTVNEFIYADRKVLEDLTDVNSFFIEDLKGSKVYLESEDGEYVGVLKEIDNFGSADIFYINSVKYKNLTIPHVEGLIKIFHQDEKILVLNKKGFSEVAVYGD